MKFKMKKKMKNINILLLLLVILTATSCLQDDPLVNWPDKNYIVEIADADHAFARNDVIVGTTIKFDKMLMNQCAVYASHITSSFDVQLGINVDLVARYNTNNGLNGSAGREPFVLMPAANYTLPTKVTIEKGIRSTEFDVDVNTTGLNPGAKYLIPVIISSVPEPYIISGNFGYINLLVTTVARSLMFDFAKQELKAVTESGVTSFKDIVVKSVYALDNTTITLDIDAALVSQYNSANALDGSTDSKKPYVLMPAAAYTLPASMSFGSTAGLSSDKFDLVIDTSSLVAKGKYMIPLIMDSTTSASDPLVDGDTPINDSRGRLYLLLEMP